MEQNKQKCILYYETEAEKYDSRRFECLCRRVVDRIFKQTIYHFIHKANCILDAGTGTGRFAKYFAENGKKVLAMDTSESMLEKTRNKFVEAGLEQNLTLVQGDIEKIPLEDNSVDAITCIHVMVHFEKLDKAVKEFARVLKPNGNLVFELANSSMAKWYNKLWAFTTGKKHYSFMDYYRNYQSVKDILEKNNITVIGRKRIKKVPKFIMHTLLCKLKLSFIIKPVELLERLNFGFVTIICGQKES